MIQQSNARVATLPPGIVALFIGATSGIGQSALQNFAHHASAPHIYTVSLPRSVDPHQNLLTLLRQSNPTGTYNLITADVSLVSDIDKVVNTIIQKETKLDILFMSAGFMAFEGRKDTREGLDPSMSTRYYSRLRAVQKLLPLLNSLTAQSPRVISVLAGGMEGPLNETDLDLKDPSNWSPWNASVHTTTMGTLALERLARENPRVSIVHSFPGPVATPGLAKARKFGMAPSNPMSQDEAGARAVFLATSDRYSVQEGGLVPVVAGLEFANKSGGGVYLVDPLGESADNENFLAGLRRRGVGETIWDFTQKIFADCAANSKDEL